MIKRLRRWLLGILVEALEPHLLELRAIRVELQNREKPIAYVPVKTAGTGPFEPLGPISGTKIFR